MALEPFMSSPQGHQDTFMTTSIVVYITGLGIPYIQKFIQPNIKN